MNNHRTKTRARSKRTSDRYGVEAGLAYNDNLRSFMKQGSVAEAAKDARDALDGPEGPELRAAEHEGKSRADVTITDRALGVVHRVRRAVRAALQELRN